MACSLQGKIPKCPRAHSGGDVENKGNVLCIFIYTYQLHTSQWIRTIISDLIWQNRRSSAYTIQWRVDFSMRTDWNGRQKYDLENVSKNYSKHPGFHLHRCLQVPT